MPNFKVKDILDNPENKMGLYGFCGKILRINLTERRVSTESIYPYVPEYIGGRMIINRIFWDEVPMGTGPFDEENKFIYMTGPTTGTGIPAGGRSAACSIGCANNPEMFTWGNIGGYFATELKYAGYDGFILEGRADQPTYVKIEDDKVEFLPAGELWGLRVHPTQDKLEQLHGREFRGLVIGPAGENLVRIASITTGNDCVFAKGGFGAVWGAKNLKAITVHGTGIVAPADIDQLIHLRMTMNEPAMKPSPVRHLKMAGVPGAEFEAPNDQAHVACSPGCKQHCNELYLNGKNAFTDELVAHIEKCVSRVCFTMEHDRPATVGQFWPTEKNYCAPCKLLSKEFPKPDTSDPYLEQLNQSIPPDVLNYWGPDYDRATIVNDMCNDYGIDKWEILIWLQSWLSMCKKEHLLDGNDLGTGMEVDVDNVEFMKRFITNLVYRKGYYGDLFAEGMSRAIRTMGYETFSETIYHGRYSMALGGKRIDLPVSLEAAWGQSVHWQGRGFQGAIDKPTWLAMNLINMTSSRDAQTVEHFHCEFKYHAEAVKDPYHCRHIIDAIIHTQNFSEIKDSIMSCEWQSPDFRWPTMECEMYQAATGYQLTVEELERAAYRSKLLFRAILIRDSHRSRKQEMEAIWRTISIPDSYNETADWTLWNEMVDAYYEARGWDLETGWPYRETYEKYGLKDVADTMEKLGLLPVRPEKRWRDYGQPPYVKFVENRRLEPDFISASSSEPG